jgi:hypothetical protein
MTGLVNLTKSLIVQEDLEIGETTVSQTRGGTVFPSLNQFRFFYPVNSLVELNALDPLKYKKACLFINSEYTLYSYYGGSWKICSEALTTNPLTLINSWVNDATYQVATVSKKPSSEVRLSGCIKNGTATSGTIIANLPVAYRPTTLRRLVTGNSAGLVILSVAVNGDLKIESGTNALIALDHLSYNI